MKGPPKRYFSGLSEKQKLQRLREIQKFSKLNWKDPRAYVGFKSNLGVPKKRRSSYTIQWEKLFPGIKSLENRSRVTGVPVKYLHTVFNRGMAAWRTGHRPGMSQQAWSYPRVSSFLLCGKTHYTTNANQVSLARRNSRSARKWFTRCK